MVTKTVVEFTEKEIQDMLIEKAKATLPASMAVGSSKVSWEASQSSVEKIVTPTKAVVTFESNVRVKT